ncbi:MAG: serine--tRNA ligase [SAR202 cluster bacterium]|nr:serine--tRNA ligase [SAR202 cluster bacterium]|tara:strand:- start:9137 stop:10408 length:1272 start_codon:yes stop_codon:yes gene_type:complete
MIDIRQIREEPDLVKSALALRGEETSIETILELDKKKRLLLHESEEMRAQRNSVSRNMSNPEQRTPEIMKEMRELGERIKTQEDELHVIDNEIQTQLSHLPNLPDPSVPFGEDERANKVVRIEGDTPSFDFETEAHWDLGTRLDIIDFERGARMAGSRFYVLKKKAAKLQRALIQWMLDLHTEEHQYTEIYPPYMITEEGMRASGQLPKFQDNLYRDIEEDLWMIPTAEVPLTNMHRDEIFDIEEMPISYTAYTACFRREKMSAGRDVRGIKRGHQFDKVELYRFVKPEDSLMELKKLLSHAEEIPKRLGLAYRVVELCTGDLGAAAAKSFDIEVWAPGCKEWLEVSSCSTCSDFQARRANIRYRPVDSDGQTNRPEFVHTLNGSGVALPRIMIAIMETYQQENGSINIPEVLRPYTGFSNID